MANRSSPTSSSIIVAAAIIQQEGRLLVTKRNLASHLGGLWEFPGGKIEPGETLEDCLRREMKEELGIEISDPQFFHSLRHQYPEKEVELNFFTCSILHGDPQALDCVEIKWIPKHALTSYQFPPADIPLIKKLTQGNPEAPVS